MILKLSQYNMKINCSLKKIKILLIAGKWWQTHNIMARLESDITFYVYCSHILQQNNIIYKVLYFFAIVLI